MDVPRPDDEEQGGDLSIEEAHEDTVRERVRRIRPRNVLPELVSDDDDDEPEDEAVVEGVLEAVEDARARKRANTAPHRSQDEKMRAQRLHPAFDISLEMAILRPVLATMQVPVALAFGNVLRGAHMILTSDDALWRHWWRRDFPEMVRFLGEDAEQPPSWITDSAWKRALLLQQQHGEMLLPASPALLMYSKMPWRCWYVWSEFFRRSALWHIARLLNEEAEEWTKPSMRMSERDPRWRNRPSTVYKAREGVRYVKLKVPRFSHVMFTRDVHGQRVRIPLGSYLVSAASSSELHDVDSLVLAHDHMHDVHVQVQLEDGLLMAFRRPRFHRFPMFWLLALLQHRNRESRQRASVLWRSELETRKFPATLSLGLAGADVVVGRDELSWGPPPTTNVSLNVNYVHAMQWFSVWWADRTNKSDVLAFRWAPIDAAGRNAAQVAAYNLAVMLPAYPHFGGVWFVGSAVAIAQTALPPLMCVGCHAAGGASLRCKHCKKGYCSTECHKQNQHRGCEGCEGK